MKKLFIHNILFRLVGPLFIGTIVYLLILLINNSISQVEELYTSRELYLCIFLVYVVFESARLAIVFLSPRIETVPFYQQVLLQFLTCVVLMVLLVYGIVSYYFQQFVGFSASMSELVVFYWIYGFMMLLYLSLHFSHLFLFKENRMKLDEEVSRKKSLEFEFRNFKREMNPMLLLESLESLIVISEEKIESADELIDELSVVYRYILGSSRSELVPVSEEVVAVQHLLNLFWYQGIDVDFQTEDFDELLCVPGTFLTVMEWLVRSSIHSTMQSVAVDLRAHDQYIVVVSSRKEKLNSPALDLNDIRRSYEFYTDQKIDIENIEGGTIIRIPILAPVKMESIMTEPDQSV
ncbi:MAG: histidine kinase [Bacteroidota bacterium]